MMLGRLHTVKTTLYLFNLVTRIEIGEKLCVYSFLGKHVSFGLSSDET